MNHDLPTYLMIRASSECEFASKHLMLKWCTALKFWTIIMIEHVAMFFLLSDLLPQTAKLTHPILLVVTWVMSRGIKPNNITLGTGQTSPKRI